MRLMRVLIYRFAFACILCFFFCSCSKENSQAPDHVQIAKETMQGNALELVDVAIALYAKQSSFNPCPLSSRIQSLIKKHSNKTFEMSSSAITWRDFEATIPDGGKIAVTFKSDRPVTMQFTKGLIGIRNNEIYVQEDTQMEMDSKLFSYRSGKWEIQTGSPLKPLVNSPSKADALIASGDATTDTIKEFGTTFKGGQPLFYIILSEHPKVVIQADKTIAVKYGLIKVADGEMTIAVGKGDRVRITYKKKADDYVLTSFQALR